jgi:GH24 family phage-related lysozyme (muramidase)
MANTKLSNVIGAPFSEYVLTQLNLRAFHNSTGYGNGNFSERTPQEILFLANKSAWVKLTSSVKIVNDPKEFYKKLELDESYSNPEDLAKRWILEAGTSIADGDGIELRRGIGVDGAYGLGGTYEMGYRPMPGLTSVTIDTKGTLGSLREATISFKVWNMNQLNIIEALYFRLGYSMLLEWGHTQFYTNVNSQGTGGTFNTKAYGINPFVPGLRKEDVQQQLNKQGYNQSGNYDGMLGIVSNFHWSFNQEGGYDCSVRLIGLGSIIDTIRTNLSYKMPNTLFQTYISQQETLAEQTARDEEIKRQQEIDKQRAVEGKPRLVPAATNNEGIKAIIASDNGVSNVTDTELAKYSYATAYSKEVNTIADYYYKARQGGKTPSVAYKDELNSIRTGLFLSPIPGVRNNLQVAYVDGEKDFILSKNLLNSLTTTALTQERVKTPSSGRWELSDVNKLDVGLGIDTFPRLFALNYQRDNTASLSIPYNVQIKNPRTGTVEFKIFYIDITYQPIAGNNLTVQEITDALQRWFSLSRKIQVNSIEFPGGLTTNPVITGTLKDVVLLGKTTKKNPTFTIKFDNTALIESVTNVQINPTQQTPVQAANPGDEGGEDNVATNTQVDTAERFASSLHAMLAAVKSQIQYNTPKDPSQGVYTVPLQGLTEAFYRDGILEGIFNTQPIPNTRKFDLKQYALKGFNSYLMADPDLFFAVPKVDFVELSKGYGIRYTIQDQQNNINFPTYIKFGYLMAFLNNMCLIYDSVQDTNKHPFIYLDFNPETNFCLTTPQHLSVDPFTCMIPFEGSAEDYLKLFPPDLVPNSKTDNTIFSPKINAVSSYLPGFKTENVYQGKIMEILLNVDFLTETLNQYTTKNTESIINLKGFLDAIVNGVNKATGNLNLFRVSYRDDSNTVVIKDDQFVPPLPNESWMLRNNSEPSNYQIVNGVNVSKYGELPVFGKQSLVRAMQFETNLSTNMSNIIAISGQSSTKAVNSTDHSAFSYLNTHFEDRYKPRVTDSSTEVAKSNQKQQEKKEIEEHDLDQATQFNAHIVSVYYGGYPLSKKKIPFAINYYINSTAVVKSTDNITLGAPIIPANLNITLDGISGIVMGNAFTIPEDRLPASLRGNGGLNKNAKVGFVVVGLTHTLESNQWLTQIRGQMIRLRDDVDYGTKRQLVQVSTAFPANVIQLEPVATSADLSSLNLTESWLTPAFNFIAAKEGFIEVARFDTNRFRGGYGSDIKVQANGEINSVTSTTTFTRQEGELTLKYNLIRFKNGVIGQIGQSRWEKLTDSQKAALVSYAYNAGAGALSTWNIAKAIITNQSASQVAQFIATGPITAKGEVLKGLVTRRAEEAQLYLK